MAHAPVQLLCITGAEIMRLVDPLQLLDALAEGFRALTRGEVQAPPRPKIEVAGEGFTLAMLAASPGQATATKVVSVFDANHARGLASHQALVALFDRHSGVPVAILDGASLTGLRTAGAAILSVRMLARTDARTAAVIGGGVQGIEHVRQVGLVRRLDEIRVYARSPEAARRAAAAAPNARVVGSAEEAVRGADIVCLTTSSATPVVEADWIAPGTHVTSVGFAPPGSEVPRQLIDRAALFVETRSAFEPAPVGCAELAGMDRARGAELGEVLAGTRPGRTSDDQITLYKSMGNAMEDMVAANLALAAARAAGAGRMAEI